MTDASLRTLEGLRRDAVEAAQRRLGDARAALALCEAGLSAGLDEQAGCEVALSRGRLEFAAASTVSALRRAEERVRGLERELLAQAPRLGRLHRACAKARAEVERETQALTDAELARRALGQLLDARREAADKRRERGEEDQLDDSAQRRRADGPRRGP